MMYKCPAQNLSLEIESILALLVLKDAVTRGRTKSGVDWMNLE